MWIILIVLVVLIAYVVMIYNRLISMIEEVKNNQKQIDIQLDRRYKVFESLVNVVRKYMDYEQSTLKQVTALRTQAENAKQSGDEKTRMEAENKISGILSGLNLVFENYPDLKANQNVAQLMDELSDTENKIQASHRFYNGQVRDFNIKIEMFPNSFFAKMLKFAKFDFFEIEDAKERENVKVSL